jgi:hypothetical protein
MCEEETMKLQKQIIRFFSVALIGSVIVTGCGGGAGGNANSSDGSGDNSGGSNQSSNSAPQISGSAEPFVQATTQYDFKPTARDGDGDTLTYSVQNLPAWANFDANTGELSGQPGSGDIGQYNDITISVSDGADKVSLAPFSVEVFNPPLTKQSIGTQNATVTTTADGFDATGDVTVTSGGNTTELKNANLQFKFDGGDNLSSVTGTATLPASISDYLLIPNPLTVKVGLYSGAQINADPDIGVDSSGGIRLVDKRQYLVFFIGAEMNISYQNKNSSSQVPITLGLGEAQTLIIEDPTDPFAYMFGYENGLGFGTGYSLHGLIPYVSKFADTGPDAFPQLDTFYGNEVDKGVFPVGIKVFDLLSITGDRVLHNPSLYDIDWTNPLDSNLHYQAGYNGSAEFSFGVVGIGLFSYHLADASATLEVGVKRQHLALQGVYQPTEDSQPIWLPARPSPEPTDKLVANLSFDPTTGIAMELRGKYLAAYPSETSPTYLQGSMHLDQNGLSLSGTIDDASNPITLSASASNDEFDATVQYKVDVNADLTANVLDGMDSIKNQVQSAVTDYTNAVAGYDLAVSLNGLRAQLPTIADKVIATLTPIPGDVYTTAYKDVYDYLYHGKKCPTSLKCYYYRDYVDESAVAKSVATKAKNDATHYIAPYLTALNDLKVHAAEADAASLRQQLKNTLLQVYGMQKINKVVNYSYSYSKDFKVLGKVVYTLKINYSNKYTIRRTLIPPADAAIIKTAADNVDTIPAAYTVMLNAHDIVNSLPTESAIDQAKQEVQQGLTKVPSFDGVGFSKTKGGPQTAYIILSGKKYAVEFNLLDPINAVPNIIGMISSVTIQQASNTP